MVTALDVFRIAERERIIVEWRNLGPSFLGIWLFDSEIGQAYICLNTSIKSSTRLSKCVLAHELGHHFKTAGQHILAATATQLYRVVKSERLANDWATDMLVPGDEFLELIQKQYTFDELMDYFDVVPDLIIHRAKKIYENGLRVPELKAIWRNNVFRVMG